MLEPNNPAWADGMLHEIEVREAKFVEMLTKAKRADLAAFYNDLITLRHAHNVVTRVTKWDFMSSSDDGSVTLYEAKTKGEIPPPRLVGTNDGNGDFVLRTAVRNQVLQFGSRRFTTREMYEALHRKYPQNVGESRLPSISATLANLTTMGELVKTTDGQRKVRFIAAGIEPAT